MRKECILFLCLLAGACEMAFAYTASNFNNHKINHYSTIDGLSSNQILRITQDAYGFMWIATSEGLNKFDGERFIQYQYGKDNISLSHNNVQGLLFDFYGNLWIATSNGLNIYDYKADSILVNRSTGKKGGVSSDDIMCFAKSRENGVWIGTYGNGVDYYDYQTRLFTNIEFPPTFTGVVPTQITYLYEDVGGDLWIGTVFEGLFKYNKEEKTLQHYQTPRISLIYQDSGGRIWFASDALLVYNKQKDLLEKVNIEGMETVKRVAAIEEDGSGNLWIGTDQSLSCFSLDDLKENKPVKMNIVYQQGENWGLPFNSVETIRIDRDNNVWVGTRGNGMYMIKAEENKFKLLTYNRLDKNSLSNNKVEAVCADKAGNLYFGIDGYGIDRFGTDLRKTKNYRCGKNENTGLSDDIIISSLADSKGNLWFGTFSGGLNKLPLHSERFITYFSDRENDKSLVYNDVRCVYESLDGTIWVGTTRGLSKMTEGEFDNTFNKKTGKSVDIRSIAQANDSVIWLGTYGEGLISYDYRNYIIRRYYNQTDPTKNYIFSLQISGDSIWFATQGAGVGLRSIAQKKDMVYFDQSAGLINNYVQCLIRDKQGAIWVSSNKGISMISKEGKIQNFDSKDGLQENQFSQGTIFINKDGRENIAFAGYDGVNVFDPLDLPRNKRKDKILFTSLKIFNQTIRPGMDVKNGNPLIQNIIETNRLVLQHSQSFFSIGFISLDYNDMRKTRYSYMLSDLDKQWNDIGQQSEITFRNLPAGKYMLKIRTSDSNGDWNEDFASLEIVVLPVFWKTPLAYSMYVLAVLLLLYVVWRVLTINIRAQNKVKLEKAKRLKDEEVHQAKLQFFTNISHELRTPLTLIIGPLKQLTDDPENNRIRETLDLVLKNSNKLLMLVNQILDFRKTEKGEMNLRVANGEIVQCVRQIIDSFDSFKQNKEMQITVSTSPLIINGWFDRNFLEIILNNLLSNAYKNTPRQGHISVEVTQIVKDNRAWAEIKVIDNGKGIPKHELGLIFNRFYQTKPADSNSQPNGTGIGLHLVSRLLALHRGTIAVESKLDKGSVFSVELPIDRSAYKENEIIQDESHEHHETLMQEEIVDADSRLNLPRILVVEDDEEIRDYVKRILFANYRILEAGNGVEALKVIEKEDCDIVVSDIMMPQMDGITLCKTLKSKIETSHIPVILLTAKSSMDDRIEGLEVGADSYIPKPFHPKHLMIRVEKLVESRRLFKERFSKTLSFQPTPVSELSMDECLLQKIVNYISENLSNSEMNGDDIGMNVNMSRMHLHRKLKSLTGSSTSEFVRLIRLKQAAYLIENTQKNMSEICYDTGFGSPSYFTTCFTNYYKIPPTAYMKEKRKTKDVFLPEEHPVQVKS